MDIEETVLGLLTTVEWLQRDLDALRAQVASLQGETPREPTILSCGGPGVCPICTHNERKT